jgi:hypothetical protein
MALAAAGLRQVMAAYRRLSDAVVGVVGAGGSRGLTVLGRSGKYG